MPSLAGHNKKHAALHYDAGGAVYNVKHPNYGAIGDGLTNDTAAIILAISAASLTGGTVYFPPGTYKVITATSAVPVNVNRVWLVGAGMGVSTILFTPTAHDSIAVDFRIPTGTVQTFGNFTQGGIKDISIRTDDTTFRKVGIRAQSVSEWICRRVQVTGPWIDGSNSSIGLQVQGHEIGSIYNNEFFANIPISIEQNPRWEAGNYAIDHFNFHNNYLLAGANPNVRIQDGVWGNNVSFTGYLAMVLGTHGVYWNNTVDVATSQGWSFDDLRWEGATDPGYALYMAAAMSGLRISGQTGSGTVNKGLYLRKARRLRLDTFLYGGTIEALNVDDTVRELDANGCLWQDSSTVSGIGYNATTGMDITWAHDKENTLAPLPGTFRAESTLNGNRAIRIFGRRFTTGIGDPNGAVLGSIGDEYTNLSGGASTTKWIKESGTATNTGWVGK